MEHGGPTTLELAETLDYLKREINVLRAAGASARRRRRILFLLVPIFIGSALALLVAGSERSGVRFAGILPEASKGQPLVFKVDNGEAMRLATGGNLGIGTSSPTAKLDVNGSIRAAGSVATAGEIATDGDLQVAGTGIITGTLNAVGGLDENGNPLRNTYVSLHGSYSDPAWITSLAASKLRGPIASATTAGSTVSFTGKLSGDVTGTQSSTTVSQLHGVALSGNAPGDGQVLEYNHASGQWQPMDLPLTLSKLTYVSKSDTANVNGGHASGRVYCPSGTHVLGGGVTGSNADASIVESAPDPSNNAWDYYVINTNALAADGVQAWVICA